MKQTLLTFLLISAMGLVSCRKDKNEPDIKQYDQQQIQSYIAANGITGMQRDTVGGDTSGIYYKIITPGTGPQVDYPDAIFYVYTIRSFDGKYALTDTIMNHFYGYLGHTAPWGLTLSIHNLLKYRGGKMRVLIPSHLAYGISGAGTGSSTLSNGRIEGNQCLDYTIELINDAGAYDAMVIQNYMKAHSLSGYTKITSGIDSGMYYKITTVGTGTQVTNNSSGAFNDLGRLMNNSVIDDHSDTSTTSLPYSDLLSGSPIEGVAAALRLSKAGGGISVIFPSRLGYGASGITGSIPANSCLRFDITHIKVNQ